MATTKFDIGWDDCDREWAIAKLICRELIDSPSPPPGITGNCATIYDCARGLVSERCGGNAVVYGKDSR